MSIQDEKQSDSVGMTSSEGEATAPTAPSRWSLTGTYELMALISLIAVTAATILMFIEIRSFGEGFPFGGFPWRVDAARAAPVSSK